MIDGREIWYDFQYALGGIGTTLMLVLVPLLIAVPLGFLMAIVNVRRIPVLSQLFRVYISFMRGTPIIVQIFLIYNALPLLFDRIIKAWGLPIRIWDIDNIVYALAAFTLSEVAILAEVFRAALNGIDSGQVEAAECVGLTTFQAYTRIIVPQAFAAAIPVVANSATSLIKTTSLAFSMAINDVTGLAKIQGAYSSDYFDAYLAVFLVYLVLVLATEQVFKLVDKRMNRFNRVGASVPGKTAPASVEPAAGGAAGGEGSVGWASRQAPVVAEATNA